MTLIQFVKQAYQWKEYKWVVGNTETVVGVLLITELSQEAELQILVYCLIPVSKFVFVVLIFLFVTLLRGWNSLVCINRTIKWNSS